MLPIGNWLGTNPNYMIQGLWDLMVVTRANPANLFESWGKEAVFEKNVPAIAAGLKMDGLAPPPNDVLALIHGTGILDGFPLRDVVSLRLPSGKYVLVLAAATVAWYTRRCEEAKRWIDMGLEVSGVYLLASDRQCNSSTEINHPAVQKYMEEEAKKQAEGLEPGIFHQLDEPKLPTEAQLYPLITRDVLGIELDEENIIVGKNLDENITALADRLPAGENSRLYVPNNANAAVPLQIRRGLRKVFSGFDEQGGQLHFSQDGFPLAWTEEQLADPSRYQRPFTALAGIARWVNELHQLNA